MRLVSSRRFRTEGKCIQKPAALALRHPLHAMIAVFNISWKLLFPVRCIRTCPFSLAQSRPQNYTIARTTHDSRGVRKERKSGDNLTGGQSSLSILSPELAELFIMAHSQPPIPKPPIKRSPQSLVAANVPSKMNLHWSHQMNCKKTQEGLSLSLCFFSYEGLT